MRARQVIARLVASAVAAAGTLVGVSALGGGSASTAAGAATAPVVIGDICSCTGPEASTISQTTATMQAWASWVNSHGGLDGHQVQLIVKDDQYNPGIALSSAESLVQGNHAIAIFDNSDEDPSFASYLQQQGVPVLGGSETDSGYKNPDFFPPGASFNYSDVGLTILAKRDGIKKEATLYCVEVAICKEATDEGKLVNQKYGLQTSYTAGISFAAPNYTAQCLAAKASGATGMSVGDASAIVDKVAQNCAAQGFTPTEISSDGTVAIAWLGIPAMDGNVDTQADLPWFVHNSATRSMYAALTKYAPAVPVGSNFGEVVLQAWSAGALLQAAVAASPDHGAPTAGGVKAGLYALPAGTTLGGLAPPLHYVKGQDANIPCYFVMGIEHGKFVWINHGKLVDHGSNLICPPKTAPGQISI